MALSSHQQRLITAGIMLVVLSTVLYCGGWALRLAVLLIAGLALYEFFCLYWPGSTYKRRKAFGVALGALPILAQAGGAEWAAAALATSFCLVGVAFTFAYSRNPETKLGHYSPLLHALLYIPLMLQLALYLTAAEQVFVLLAAIASDTGGYYAGRRFGSHKLWPAISPKKTWEGLIGGLVLALVACTAFIAFAGASGWSMPALPLPVWVLLAFLLNQAALFGDFFESAVKRSLEIKDSGTILPGHGGILDRIDSLLFALPVYCIAKLAATALCAA